MNKNFVIPAPDELTMYKLWIASINWTLGSISLTESELEVLAILLLYNNKYKDIKNPEVRSELLFSSSTKKKIREQYGYPVQKLETYLNRLRKKGIISDNRILEKFVVYIEDKFMIGFTFTLTTNVTQSEQIPDDLVIYTPNPVSDEEEPPAYTGDPWDRHMKNFDIDKIKTKNGTKE